MAAKAKGPRASVGLRIPVDLRSPLARAARSSGLSQNDYIVGLIATDLGRADLVQPIQEVLPDTA